MTSPPVEGRRTLTEGGLAEELGVERLEIYLLAAVCKAGQYDSVTHLLLFNDAEADALAARLGVARRARRMATSAANSTLPAASSE